MKRRQQDRLPGPLHRARSCTGKKRYRSEAEAFAMLRAQQEYGKDVDDIHPYKCDFCRQWHIGHRMTGE